MGEAETPKVKEAGIPIHFVRPQETGCRPGKLLEDAFEEMARAPLSLGKPPGRYEFGHFSYGDPKGSGALAHTFEATRVHDPLGTVDTWHLAADCPFKEAPKTREVPRAREPQAP